MSTMALPLELFDDLMIIIFDQIIATSHVRKGNPILSGKSRVKYYSRSGSNWHAVPVLLLG